MENKKDEQGRGRRRRSLRDIVEIDDSLCDGCGQCLPSCAEGALAVVDGLVTLAREGLCDGLGACLGHCPKGALSIVKKFSENFDPQAVEDNRRNPRKTDVGAADKDADASRPPLSSPRADAVSGNESLSSKTGEQHPLEEEIDSLTAQFKDIASLMEEETTGKFKFASLQDLVKQEAENLMAFQKNGDDGGPEEEMPADAMALSSWPIQLALIPPKSKLFATPTLIVAADCVAYACPDFHARFLGQGHPLAICCSKLDDAELYVAKLSVILRENPNVVEVLLPIMEVPCCRGLWRIALRALERSGRKDVDLKGWIITPGGKIVESNYNIKLRMGG
ncbi:MAG: hypothetical protein LBJ64_06925 [Deltaproteobacteria bacterium]|jgi:ferredoxin|nr:hypothetical protein [Deltaproteobacteria bacterium]